MNQTENQSPLKLPIPGIAIVGINLLVVVIYSLIIFRTNPATSEIIFYSFIAHSVFCVLMAVISKKSNSFWAWVISSCLIPSVFFSSCVLIAISR